MLTLNPNASARKNSGLYGAGCSAQEASVIVLPMSFDGTTTYREGTRHGPKSVAEASAQVELYDKEMGHPWQHGIRLLTEAKLIKVLNTKARQLVAKISHIHEDDLDPENEDLLEINECSMKMNEYGYERAKRWISQGKLFVTLGGEHSVVYGPILAHAERYPHMGIVQIDAHCDLRPAFQHRTFSHASVMYNVAESTSVKHISQVGVRSFCPEEEEYIKNSKGRIEMWHWYDLYDRIDECGGRWQPVADEIVRRMPNHIYFTLDCDGLLPSCVPFTGTPVPGGLTFDQVRILLRTIYRAGKVIIGCDLNEIAPGPRGDISDANTGAYLLYLLIGWMLKTQENT